MASSASEAGVSSSLATRAQTISRLGSGGAGSGAPGARGTIGRARRSIDADSPTSAPSLSARRLGLGVLADLPGEALEQPVRVVRPRARLGVILDREHRPPDQLEPGHGLVEQVEVGQRCPVAEARDVDREAVVLRGDRDGSIMLVADRMVAAVVAELELVGAAAERQAQQLMAQTDAEDRQLAALAHQHPQLL